MTARADPPRLRDWLVAIATVLVVVSLATVVAPRLAGVSLDATFWLRHQLMPRAAPADAPVAIVAIDEETYHTPPFRDLPDALWTSQIATVLDALVAADAKVIGFDAIYPTSLEPLVPGFDHDFLISVNAAARDGKIVLGELQHRQFPVVPSRAQRSAVGDERNIRSVDLVGDRDGVIRRVPLSVEREQDGTVTAVPSMALELASRASGAAPKQHADGGVELAGYEIPGGPDNAMLLNFPDHAAVPIYSLADLYGCAAAGQGEFFRRHFAGKVVLLGVVLDDADRKLAANRYITEPQHESRGPRCALAPRTELLRRDQVRDTTPGIYLVATAVDNLLDRNALSELPPAAGWIILFAATLAAAIVALRLPPAVCALLLLGGTLLWGVAATLALRAALVLPLIAPPLAAGFTLALLLGYRIGVADRQRRLLRSRFALYAGSALIDRIVGADRRPQLGGEARRITLFLSDGAGFTALSEALAPDALVAVVQRYLSEMTEIIEAEGGFIGKYVGDSIVAIFGAPLDEPRHALAAARAALRCRARLLELNDADAFHGHRLGARIGLATGPALVGNIGSPKRFSYTAIGDTVTLAACLAGANKPYGTAILANATTRHEAGDSILWREIDRVRVVDRVEPVTLFEPVAAADATPAELTETAIRYGAALEAYRTGRFAAALILFETLASRDPPSRLFVTRLRGLVTDAPPEGWDGVTQIDER